MLAVAAGSLAALLAVRKRVAASSLAPSQCNPSLCVVVKRSCVCISTTYTPHVRELLYPPQRRDSRVYIELARDDCRTLAARAAAPIKTPLLEALSRCLLRYVLLVLRVKEPATTNREGKPREEVRGREASVLPYLGSPPLLFRSPSPEGPGAVHVSTFDRTKDYRPNSWTPWKASSSLENILLVATLLGELHSPSHSPVILPLLQRCPSSCLLHLLSRWTYVLTYMHVRTCATVFRWEYTVLANGSKGETTILLPARTDTCAFAAPTRTNYWKLVHFLSWSAASTPTGYRPATEGFKTSPRVDLFQRSLACTVPWQASFRSCCDSTTDPRMRRFSDSLLSFSRWRTCAHAFYLLPNHFDDRRPIEM